MQLLVFLKTFLCRPPVGWWSTFCFTASHQLLREPLLKFFWKACCLFYRALVFDFCYELDLCLDRLAQWLSCYQRGSIKTMRAQSLWFEARPDRTMSPGSGQKWGARGPSARLASAKLVIRVKYGIFIYLLLSRRSHESVFHQNVFFPNFVKSARGILIKLNLVPTCQKPLSSD